MSENQSHILTERLRLFKETTVNERGAAGLSFAELTKLLGFPRSKATSVAKYINGNFEGNRMQFESLVRSALECRSAREATASKLFDSPPVELVRRMCATLKKKYNGKRWIGGLHGDSGVGKTCGANKTLLADLSAIYTKIVCYKKHNAHLVDGVYTSIANEDERKARKLTKIDWMEEVLRDTDRVLIVDDAHLLHRPGRQFYCDLNDRLNIGILLIGNPEMYQAWQEVPQQRTRLKLCEKVCHSNAVDDRYVDKDVEDQARNMIALHAPESGETLFSRAVKMVRGGDRLRGLETTLELAKAIIGKGAAANWLEAWESAESQQVRSLNL